MQTLGGSRVCNKRDNRVYSLKSMGRVGRMVEEEWRGDESGTYVLGV